MPTPKQIKNDIRDAKIIKEYSAAIKKASVNKTKFAEAHGTSLRSLNRVLESAGLKDTKFIEGVKPVVAAKTPKTKALTKANPKKDKPVAKSKTVKATAKSLDVSTESVKQAVKPIAEKVIKAAKDDQRIAKARKYVENAKKVVQVAEVVIGSVGNKITDPKGEVARSAEAFEKEADAEALEEVESQGTFALPYGESENASEETLTEGLEPQEPVVLPQSTDTAEVTEMTPTKEAVVGTEEVVELSNQIISWTVDKAKFISVLLDNGDNLSVESTHEHYKEIIAHLISDEYIEALIKMSVVHKINSLELGGFVVTNNGVTFNGSAVKHDIVNDVVDMFARSEPIEYLLRFYENLMLTASEHIYTHLWKLIKHAGVTITPEGNVECYKRIKSDFTDCYSGKIPNNIGDTVSMRRSEVNADFNQTCAAGLHVCAKQYLTNSGYGGSGIIVKVVVRPQDFVSIPPDYQFTKARTCSYKVIGLDK